jgi:hypothetical protein
MFRLTSVTIFAKSFNCLISQQPGKNSHNRTGRIGQSGHDFYDRTARKDSTGTGLAGQDIQEVTVRKGQLGMDRQNWTTIRNTANGQHDQVINVDDFCNTK